MREKVENFIDKIRPVARKVEEEEGFNYLFLMAQAALETGWLERETEDDDTGAPSRNLFNIKGEYKGEYVTILTTEYDEDDESYQIEDKFRKYPSYEESVKDWLKLLKTPRYCKAYENRGNLIALAYYTKDSGYATDPSYVDKLVRIAEIIEEKCFMMDNDFKSLRKGNEGDDVLWVQEKLDEAGYNLEVDGVFGPQTKKILKNFQKDSRLEPTGKVGMRTYEKILATGIEKE